MSLQEQFIYVYECVRHFITMDDDSDYGEEIAESKSYCIFYFQFLEER